MFLGKKKEYSMLHFVSWKECEWAEKNIASLILNLSEASPLFA